MYGIVICKSFYFTKSLIINDIFLRYKCPVKSFAFFLLAFINFWVRVLFTCYVRDIVPCCFTVIFTLLGCYVVRFQALKTLFLSCRFSNLFKDHRQPKQEVQWLVLTELLFATRMSVVQSMRPEENAKKLALFSFSYWSSPRSLLRTHGRSSWSKSMYTVKTFNSLALICPARVDPGPTLLSIM